MLVLYWEVIRLIQLIKPVWLTIFKDKIGLVALKSRFIKLNPIMVMIYTRKKLNTKPIQVKTPIFLNAGNGDKYKAK